MIIEQHYYLPDIKYLPIIYTSYQYEALAIPQDSLMYRGMFFLSEVARMPNGSKLTNISHGRPAPRSSVDFHSINHGDHGKQYREYNDLAYEERASASNSDLNGSEVFIDMITNNNNGIQWTRHETRSPEIPTAISALFCPVTGNHSPCNGQLLKMKDAINAENHLLMTNIADNTLDGSIPQALDSLHSLGYTNKAQVKYMCMTQMQSCYELCIGNGCQIPRWRKGSEIYYVIYTESFETPDMAALVAAAMTKAISMWGKITGVVFKEAGRAAPATFRIKYKKSHNSYPNVYAKSFLPTESASSLVVYQKALENSSYLANILAHELGHILGLRHEFALKTEGFLPSVRFGSENYQSIMNYFDHPSKFRVSEQDREELEAFYAYGRAHYQGLSVVDVTPPLKDDW